MLALLLTTASAHAAPLTRITAFAPEEVDRLDSIAGCDGSDGGFTVVFEDPTTLWIGVDGVVQPAEVIRHGAQERVVRVDDLTLILGVHSEGAWLATAAAPDTRLHLDWRCGC